MAAWFGFRLGEDEAEDETCFWRYDSTWEEEEDDSEEEDGGGDEEGGGEPEGAEAGAGEEPEDAGERAVRSWVRGSLQAQAQVSAEGCGGPPGREWSAERLSRGGPGGQSPFLACPELCSCLLRRAQGLSLRCPSVCRGGPRGVPGPHQSREFPGLRACPGRAQAGLPGPPALRRQRVLSLLSGAPAPVGNGSSSERFQAAPGGFVLAATSGV
ncbi:uncharacterized protein LJ264_010189 isoform 1-T1 [Porphyrio hochstetteri]